MSLETLRTPARRDHLLQFYSKPELLADTVGHFLAEGLKAGAAAVVIATPAHRSLFTKALANEGVPAETVAARLVLLDAKETLTCFMTDGQPLWSSFEDTVRPVLERAAALSRGATVRAYGEMVDLLWQEGNLAAALRLEEHWHRLLADRDVALFCGYQADVLDGAFDAASRDVILRAHTHLVSPDMHGHLETAVRSAMRDVLGEGPAEALRALIAANHQRGARLPWAEAAVLWLRKNLPEKAERISGLARARLAGEPGVRHA